MLNPDFNVKEFQNFCYYLTYPSQHLKILRVRVASVPRWRGFGVGINLIK